MISDLTVCTVYFPIVNNSYPKFNIDATHLEEGRILQIDFTTCFGHMVDLPNLKQEKGIPEQCSSSIPLASFNFKFPFGQATMYSRLFTMTSWKAHNSN